MKITTQIQNLLGISRRDLTQLLGINLRALKLHETGLEALPMDKMYSLDLLYSLSKLAAKSMKDYSPTVSLAAQEKTLMKMLQQNEQQQKMLISTLKQDELGEKQQLTRASLLGLLTTIKSYKEDSWTTTMGGLFAKIPKPIFNNKERYSNRIKLKTLKFERRLLEQELQAVIDKTESAA